MRTYPKTPPRLRPLFFSEPLYYVTICTHKRARILNNDGVLDTFRRFVCEAGEKRGVAVGRFVLMPDHVHFFVRGPREFNLSVWVGLLKQNLTQCLIARGYEGPVWQRGFFDHVLRNSESYTEKWRYVLMNPVRAGLVERPEEWPYGGEIERIDRA